MSGRTALTTADTNVIIAEDILLPDSDLQKVIMEEFKLESQ